MVNRFLWAVAISSVILSGLAIYKTVQLGNEVSDRQIIKLDKKFGQSPTDPTYNPVIKITDENHKAFCSAFVIDANYAVTAGHCVGAMNGSLSKQKLHVILDSGEDANLTVKAAGFASRSDLGLILGDFNKFKPLATNLESFGFTEAAYYTCGFPYTQKKMICTEFIPQKNSRFYIDGAGYMVPGMSGGPVINARTGVAVGVNSAVGEGIVEVTPLEGFKGCFGIE